MFIGAVAKKENDYLEDSVIRIVYGGAIACEIAIRKRVQLLGMVLLSSGADLNSYTPLVDTLKKMPKGYHIASIQRFMRREWG